MLDISYQSGNKDFMSFLAKVHGNDNEGDARYSDDSLFRRRRRKKSESELHRLYVQSWKTHPNQTDQIRMRNEVQGTMPTLCRIVSQTRRSARVIGENNRRSVAGALFIYT